MGTIYVFVSVQVFVASHFATLTRFLSGFTPSREDCGTTTPTERQIRASVSASDLTAGLQSTLMRLEISPRRRAEPRQRSRTPQRVGSDHQPPALQTTSFDFTFDESKFTDAYFRAWDGDIDSDEDFADLVRPPEYEDEDAGTRSPGNSDSGGSGGAARSPSSSGVNLYHTLKERRT